MTYGSIPFGSGSGGALNTGFSVGLPTLFVYLNGADITENIIRKSKKLKEQLQERTDQFSFASFGVSYSKFDEVYVFYGSRIKQVTTNTVTLVLKENLNEMFREGQDFYVNLGTVNQEKNTISSIGMNNGYVQLTFVSSWVNAPFPGERGGILKFGGIVSDFQDRNIEILANQETSVTCVDFTALFDKKLANDTFVAKDGRYIINAMCNVTINKNKTIDALNYQTNGDIQAEWIESGDGTNPTTDDTIYQEGEYSGKFSWTFSSGTATFSASPTAFNVSQYTLANTGTPTEGYLAFWYKVNDITKCTSFTLRIGTDSSNYASITITPTTTEWVFVDQSMEEMTITGTPDWQNVSYLALVVTETASSYLHLDGIRVLETKHFRHYPYVQETAEFANFRINRIQPTEVMQRIANELSWYWYVDYERYIHLFPQTTHTAPFNISPTSNNFKNLEIDYDATRLINRQYVEGADETSSAYYYEIKEGDGITREWITKNKFVDLEIFLDANTVTDTMEAGTNTTTVVATGHGLSVDDFITNRTRGEVRQVLTVPDPDTFTVEAITGQTTGDTFSLFVAKTVAVENLNEDSTADYMSNYQEKSIRNSEQTTTHVAGEYLQFKYHEVFKIIVERRNLSSITALREQLGYTDGIVDAKNPIIDLNIKTRSEAIAAAEAVLLKYSNMVITVTFSTYIHGLETGQLINIEDTTGVRNINKGFIIHEINTREVEDGVLIYSVKASSLLYGAIELFYQILRQNRAINVDQDAIINNVVDGIETISMSDILITKTQGDVNYEETISLTDGDAVTTTLITPPFKYTPSATNPGKYNLASYA